MASAYAQNMFSGFGAVPFPGSMAHLSAPPSQEAAPERSMQGGAGGFRATRLATDSTHQHNQMLKRSPGMRQFVDGLKDFTTRMKAQQGEQVAPPGTARLAHQGGAYRRSIARVAPHLTQAQMRRVARRMKTDAQMKRMTGAHGRRYPARKSRPTSEPLHSLAEFDASRAPVVMRGVYPKTEKAAMAMLRAAPRAYKRR
jgi:hypothetical protein